MKTRITKMRRWALEQTTEVGLLVVAASGQTVPLMSDGVAAALRRRFMTDRVPAYYRRGDSVILWLGPEGGHDCERLVPPSDVPSQIRDALMPPPNEATTG